MRKIWHLDRLGFKCNLNRERTTECKKVTVVWRHELKRNQNVKLFID